MVTIFYRAAMTAAATMTALGLAWWRAWTGGSARERERQEAIRAAEHAEALGARAETLKLVQDTRDEMDSLDDDTVVRRLHDRWSRSDRS